jgi:hypothetical protein
MDGNRAYRIRDWNLHFETAESRKRKELDWVAVPNKHDGGGYRRLTRHERFAEVFAGWVLILEVASKMPTRGLLFKDGRPLDCEDLSDMTGASPGVFSLAFEACSDPRVGWIELVDVSPELSERRPGDLPEDQQRLPVRAGVAAASAGVCRSSSPTETETEPDKTLPDRNRGEHINTRLEKAGGNGTSGSIAAPDSFSDSDSPLSRMKAYAEFHSLVSPLMAKSGDQAAADATCIDQWFNNHIWPRYIDAHVGAGQFARFKQLVARARRPDVRKPMAYITQRLDRFCKT